MVKSNFFYYDNQHTKTDSRGYCVVQSMISNKLANNIHDFESHEILTILNNEIRCILNMYIT